MCFGTIPNLFFGVSCKQRVYHLLAPKGGAKSIRQAKPPGTDRRLRLKRYAASSRPRFRKAEFVVRYRATVIIDFPHMATRELAVLPILRDEACGARIADSAGGGFGPRGAPWRRSVAASRSFILASPKILRLDNVQINLTLPSLNRTLADAEDTPPRQLQINLHCARLNRIFAPLWRRDYTKNKRYTTLQRSPN